MIFPGPGSDLRLSELNVIIFRQNYLKIKRLVLDNCFSYPEKKIIRFLKLLWPQSHFFKQPNIYSLRYLIRTNFDTEKNFEVL